MNLTADLIIPDYIQLRKYFFFIDTMYKFLIKKIFFCIFAVTTDASTEKLNAMVSTIAAMVAMKCIAENTLKEKNDNLTSVLK